MRLKTTCTLLAAGAIIACAVVIGCSGDNHDEATGPRVHGLTAAQAEHPLAKIGERTITVGDIAQDLSDTGAFMRARYNSPERRREFVDQMIRFELLAQEAHRRHYDQLPEVE